MRLHALLLMFAVCAIPRSACFGKGAALTAEPNTVAPGQAVTLVWHFVGDKIMLYGGRFGHGANVTTRTSVTDRPRKTTRYAVIVWYRPGRDDRSAGGAQVHVRYEVVVGVESVAAEPLKLYRDPAGWRVTCPVAWRHDNAHLPDPDKNGLIYFQKEQDSVERIAVSFQPAQVGGADALMKRVRASAYTSYEQVRVVTESATAHAGVPAAWMVFSGQDEAHPGVTTQSLVLAFVKGSRAYVVNARTSASRFSLREAALERMVRSFVPFGD